MTLNTYIKNILIVLSAGLLMVSCKKDGGGGTTPPIIPPVVPPVTPAFDINSINDTYASAGAICQLPGMGVS